MKKIILSISLALGLGISSFANTSNSEYFLDEQAVETLVATSQEAPINFLSPNDASNTNGAMLMNGGKNKIVFLLLDFFIGGLAVHRYYMGVDGAWYMACGYAFIPVAGTVAACGDFFYVLFGSDASLNKYENNKKLFVWL